MDSQNPSDQPYLSSVDDPAFTPIVPQKPKSNRVLKAVIVTAILLFLSAGGIVAAYFLWYQNPEKVVTDSIVNMVKAKTTTYAGTLNLEGSFKLKVVLSGTSVTPAFDTNADVTITFDGKEYTIKGSVRFDDNATLFVKIRNADELLAESRGQLPPQDAPLFDNLIATINNRWIKITPEDIGMFDKDTAKKQQCVSDVLKKYKGDQNAVKEIADIYQRNRFIKIEKELGGRHGSLGYEIGVDRTIAQSFLNGVKQTSVYKSLQECDPSFELELGENTQEETAKTQLEVWIDQRKHVLTEVHLASQDTQDSQNKSDITIRPKFNEDVKVETPADFVTLKQLYAEIEALMQSAAVQEQSI